MEKQKQRLIIQIFLKALQEQMQNRSVVEANPIWLKIFNKDDLKTMVRWLYMNQIPERLDIEKMKEEELLDEIADDYHVLSYLLEQREKELECFFKPTPESILLTLDQLGLSTHILMNKPIEKWTKYDTSTYQKLYRKAGMPIPLFGVYDADVKEEDKYFTIPPMSALFEAESEAQKYFKRVITKSKHSKEELKIVML